MAQTDDYDSHDDPDWFRDELRQRDRLIADLRRRAGRGDRSHPSPPRACRGLQRLAGELARGLRHGADRQGWTWKPFWDEYANFAERYTHW